MSEEEGTEKTLLLSEAIKRGFKPGVTCCIHCGETRNLKMVLPPDDDLYCQKHFDECRDWFQRCFRKTIEDFQND